MARCPSCRDFFCGECITEHSGKLICAACLARGSAEREKVKKKRFSFPLAALLQFLVVVRLGRGFNETAVEGDLIRAGSAVPDVRLAQVAADAGLTGLAFYRGVPGTVGGALRMNAGAYQRETKDALVEARALDREGKVHVLKNADFDFAYRHSGMPQDFIATQAVYRGTPGDRAAIRAEMDKITEARAATQPIKSRTGGSTFRNPPGQKSWQLIDAAGCRGLVVGDAQVSELHCNFLINRGNATAADIENLGEEVRRRVKENSGVELEWEIVRLGKY